ncbi:MAG: sigma-70 family RNA polymerase sigma factor [Acidimicrobiales bacterium]
MTIVGEVTLGARRQADQDLDVGRTLAHLFETYADPVEALCRRRLRDLHLAEDACHETLIRAAANADRLDPGAPVWPWLATIAANVCTDMQRRMARHTVVADPPDRHSEEPHDTLARRQRGRLVEDALALLPEPARSAVYLRDMAGWSYEDIAAAQGRSAASVRSTLFRGRRLLRRQVETLAAHRRAEWPLPAVVGLTWRSIPTRLQRLRERAELVRARVGVRLDPMLLGGEMIGREVLTHASVGVILAVGATVPALVDALVAPSPVPPLAAAVLAAPDALDARSANALASPSGGSSDGDASASASAEDPTTVDAPALAVGGGPSAPALEPPSSPELADPTVPSPPALPAHSAPEAPDPGSLPEAPLRVDVGGPAPEPIAVPEADPCGTATSIDGALGCPAVDDEAVGDLAATLPA